MAVKLCGKNVDVRVDTRDVGMGRYFEAADARLLRASVCTFCDLLGLATRTLEEFSEPSAVSAKSA